MANRYWVGGNGTWDGTTTTNWSTTSGGAGGASVPGTADAVLFDYNSGTGTATIATGYTPNIVSINYQPNNFTLNLNNNTLITQTYSQANIAATNVNRVIAFGNGQINVTGFNATVATFRYDTGLSYTGNSKFNFTYTGNVGTRTITCVGYGTTVPTNIYVTSGSDTLTLGGGSGIVTGDLNLTGFSGRFTPNQYFLYGNLVLSPTMTLNGAAVGALYIVAASGNRFISINGAPLPQTSLRFPYTGTTSATYALTDANVTLPTTTFTSGTLDLATYNPNVTFSGTLSATGTNARTIKWGNGNVGFTGTNSTLIDMTNVTGLAQVGNANIQLTGNGTSGQTRTIVVGTTGATYARSISFNVTGGNDTVSVNGYYNNFTFQPAFTGSLSSTGANPRGFLR